MADVRLIDANALLVKVAHRNALDVIPGADFERIWIYSTVQLDMFNTVKAAPTIDAVPSVYARNVTPAHFSDEFVCGNCGFCCEITEIRYDDEFGMGEASVYEYECKYCPNCGAKMDGDAEG